MIELQQYWDSILQARSGIERKEKSILYWKDQVEEKSKEVSAIEEEIKRTKVDAKRKELDLSEKDEQIKKLDHRKDIIKNDKEMTALNHEIEKVRSDKDSLETGILEMYDSIEQKENTASALKAGLDELEKQAVKDIKGLEEEIAGFRELIDEKQGKIDGSVENLSPMIRTKFVKLLKSQNGKGIASIEGENCGACNFQIPFNLIQDALKENNVVTCTNCGRFLYKS